MKLSHTDVSGLTLHKTDAYNVTLGEKGKRVVFWRHKDIDNRDVGPCYPSLLEALTLSIQYAKDGGWMK
jgi:hypothetical protein